MGERSINLDARDLAERMAKMADSSDTSRRSIVDNILGLLIDVGFSRARYYESTQSAGNSGKRLVLVGSTVESQVGLQMDDSKSSRRLLGAISEASVCNAEELENLTQGKVPAWFKSLELEGRSWVDIPVRALSKDVGLLAADWVGPTDSVSRDHLEVLRLMGQLAGGMLALGPQEQLRRAVKELQPQTSTLSDILGTAMKQISSTLNAAATALFEYDWPSHRLVKTHERLSGSKSDTAHRCPEDYLVGEFLTGKAWDNPDFRYIADFQDFKSRHAGLINPASESYHSTAVGELRTAMFARIGGREPRYLLRLMNRADDPRLPFLIEHSQLQAFVDELDTDLSASIAKERLSDLQNLSLAVVKHPERPLAVIRAMAPALAKERVKSFAILSHTDGGKQLSFQAEYRNSREHSAPHAQRSWKEIPLYAESFKRATSAAIADNTPLYFGPEYSTGWFARDKLIDEAGTVVFPVESSSTFGVLIIAVDRDPIGCNPRSRMPEEVGGVVAAYAQVAITAIGARSSYLTAAGARRVLGFIGHELSTPIAILGDMGVEAISTAQLSLKENLPTLQAGEDATESLERLHQRIGVQRHQVAQLLAVAPLVAQESQGLLQVHFKEMDVFEVLQRARNQVLRDRPGFDAAIELNSSCRNLGNATCDGALIGQVFVNLFNNALKYSLPRYRGRPMTVRVLGQPQTGMVVVRVENWGIGIREDEFDGIFEPFVRGSAEDSVKAIRGMGLGLFLSRRIMVAHGGELFCSASEPTLDDPARRSKMEGYLTTFEFRLPRRSAMGTRTVNLEATSSRKDRL